MRTTFTTLGVAAATFAFAAPFLSLSAIGSAHAAEPFSFDFSYSSKDLESPENRAEMIHRLEREVSEHCRLQTGRTPIADLLADRACIDDAMDRALAAIGSSELSATADRRAGA
ncbi:UrcA family protein [bacterium]|nr:UrcA family protein [bacterium]